MESKLDLTKILKGREGVKLYSPLFGEVTLARITKDNPSMIVVTVTDGEATFWSCGTFYSTYLDAECLLFPSKDHRDWSKFREHIPVDTPVMVYSNLEVWSLRYYAGDGHCWEGGKKSDVNNDKTAWKYIVPVSEFDFENPESNKEKSIV